MATLDTDETPIENQGSSFRVSARERTLIAALSVVAITAIAFWSILFHDFVTWDDILHVYTNPYFDPVTPAHIAHFWLKQYGDLYIPVSYTFYGFLAWIAALSKPDPSLTDTGALFDPHVFHAASFALHIGCALIVFALLKRLVNQDIPAAIGALLFAIHPFQVESVAWISEIRGLLANIFSLALLLLYVAQLDRLEGGDPARLRARAMIGMVVLALLAVLSKPSAAVLAAVMLVVAVGLKARPLRSALIDMLPIVIVALPVVLVTRNVQHAPTFSIAPILDRPFIAGDALAFYLAKLVLPFNLIIDYSRTPNEVLHNWWGYATWLLPVGLAIGAYALRRRAGYVGVGLAVFAAVLLPVLGFAPFKYQAFSTVADRYVYLALLGPSIMVAYTLAQTKSPQLVYGACAIVVGLACLTRLQASHWQNSEMLYRYTIDINRQAAPIQVNYADLYMSKAPQIAEQHFRIAIKADPRYPDAHLNLGTVLENTGRPGQALAEFAIANKESPTDARIPYDMGNALMEMGKYQGAVEAYAGALLLDPKHVRAANNEGQAYLELGEFDKAVACFLRASALAPGDSRFRVNAALALIKAHRPQDAIREVQPVLTADPGNVYARNVVTLAKKETP